MNQQQLQTARVALSHQTAPLLTADEATTWLDDLGLCLFVPRHAQLPAPAPSFVEAVHGAPSAAPPPAALQRATELAARLIDERRLIPLNLLGTFSEQPDFLITPDVFPWLAGIRGDRQWKAAPGGRPAPIVLRTWEALDREGESTAVRLREYLGRELTEAAVLRALIELWTSLRAMPIALPGEPTRWTLLKNRFPAQLASGANTAQTTGLSALLSIYLRSAVAATAEEAEIFLSPLTARSRIREVVHGMTAARQLGSMSVGSHTLLFVPGSLPDNLPVEPEAAVTPAAIPASRTRPEAPRPRPPFRKEFHPKPREARASQTPGPGPTERRPGSKPWRPHDQRPPRPGQERPDRRERNERPDQRSREGRPDRRESRFRPAPSSPRPEGRRFDRDPREQRPRPGGENRSEQKPGFRKSGPKPFGRKESGPKAFTGPKGRRFDRDPREQRPRPGGENRSEQKPGFRKSGPKPFSRKESGPKAFTGPKGRRFDRDPRQQRPRSGGENRSEQKPGFRKSGPEPFGPKESGPKPFTGPEGRRFDRNPREQRPRFGGKNRAEQRPSFRKSAPKPFGQKKSGPKPFAGPRPKFPPKRESRATPAGARGPRPNPNPRFGESAGGRRAGSGRPQARGKNFKPRPNKNFRKPNPGERNPRKNRSQEENPE